MSEKSQFFGSFPYRVATSKKIVALTFDDGPNEPYTTQIANFLDSKDIKATFFSVGACVQKYPETTKRLYDAGHTIGNHSFSHSFGQYFVQPSFENEIIKSQKIIAQTIGKTPVLFRPPWLYRQQALMRTAKKLNLQLVSGVFCNIFEVAQISEQKIASSAVAKTKPGSILIFHDGCDAKGGNRANTVAATKLVVNQLEKQGYSFVTVDQLLGVKPYIGST